MISVENIELYQFRLNVRGIEMTLSESEAENLHRELERSLYPDESYEELKERNIHLEEKIKTLHRFLDDLRGLRCQEGTTIVNINI